MSKYFNFLLIMLIFRCVLASADEDIWVEEQYAGNDGFFNDYYSFSDESEESQQYDFLRSLGEIKLKKFSGEFVVRTRQEELASGTNDTSDYWYEKLNTKIRWENSDAEMGILSLRRFGEPAFSGNNYFKYQVKKTWISLNNLIENTKIIGGNYRAQYGQGLVFYGSVLEYNRPIVIKQDGLNVERGTNTNAYLNGCGFEYTGGNTTCALFGSRSFLSATLNEDKSVNEDIYALKTNYGYLQTHSQMDEWRSFYEDLAGAHVDYSIQEIATIGFTGYEAYFNKIINPSRTEERYSHVYRGRRNTVLGCDIRMHKDYFELSSEYAFSKSRGTSIDVQEGAGLVITPMIKVKPWKFFIIAYDYSPYFYNRHAKGAAFNNADPNNLEGFLYGVQYQRKPHALFCYYGNAHSEMSEWTGSNLSTSPRYPADMKELYTEYDFALTKEISVGSRLWNDTRDRYLDIDPADTTVYAQTQEKRNRTRGSVTWEPSKTLRYCIQYDYRVERVSLKGERNTGNVLYGDIVYKPHKSVSVQFRQSIFNSDNTYISQYEPVWYGIHQSYSFYGQEGLRSFVSIRIVPAEHLSVWMRYGRTELTSNTIRDDVRIEVQILF